jgi:hypothetical protein
MVKEEKTEKIMLTLSTQMVKDIMLFLNDSPKLLSFQDACRELIARGLEELRKQKEATPK